MLEQGQKAEKGGDDRKCVWREIVGEERKGEWT